MLHSLAQLNTYFCGFVRSHCAPYQAPTIENKCNISSCDSVFVDISKVQDDEVGDGTTSVTVLACELLKEPETLISHRIHPQTIISGWRKATTVARNALEGSALDHG